MQPTVLSVLYVCFRCSFLLFPLCSLLYYNCNKPRGPQHSTDAHTCADKKNDGLIFPQPVGRSVYDFQGIFRAQKCGADGSRGNVADATPERHDAVDLLRILLPKERPYTSPQRDQAACERPVDDGEDDELGVRSSKTP
jgi:hypothetical protein